MEEHFAVVGPDESRAIVAHGAVSRHLAHGPARVPHAAVQVIPMCSESGRVLLHRRSLSPRTSPGLWDFYGGHVTFEVGLLSSATAMEEGYLLTALREAREELLISLHGIPYLIRQNDLLRIGCAGQFVSGFDDPRSANVEYSSVYVVCIPKDSLVLTPFEKRDGSIEWLEIAEVSWVDLLTFHGEWTTHGTTHQLPDGLARRARGGTFPGFADGAERVLCAARNDADVARAFADALAWCGKRRVNVRVLGVVLDGRGWIAMVLNGPDKPEPGLWDLPGGGIQADESATGALKRELREELSLRKNQYTIVGLFGVFDAHFDFGGRTYDSMNVIYECSCKTGTELRIKEAMSDLRDVGWQDPSSMSPAECTARAWYAIEYLQAKLSPA